MQYIEDITIILTPHNRPRYVKRILDYLSDYPFRILIADSSQELYPEVAELSDNISYYHYPGQFFAEKMNDVIRKVDTPFVQLIAEDDFYVPESILKCVEFLKQNKDYASCQGAYSVFTFKGSFLFNSHLYKNADGKDLNQDMVIERYEELLANPIQLFYAVHKTKQLQEIFKFSFDNHVTNMIVVEHLMGFAGISEGKHKILPFYYGARESLSDSVGRVHDNLAVFFTNDKYIDQAEIVLNYMAVKASKKDGLPEPEVRKRMQKALEIYFKRIGIKARKTDKIKAIYHKYNIFSTSLKKIDPHYKSHFERIKSYIRKHPTRG